MTIEEKIDHKLNIIEFKLSKLADLIMVAPFTAIVPGSTREHKKINEYIEARDAVVKAFNGVNDAYYDSVTSLKD